MIHRMALKILFWEPHELSKTALEDNFTGKSAGSDCFRSRARTARRRERALASSPRCLHGSLRKQEQTAAAAGILCSSLSGSSLPTMWMRLCFSLQALKTLYDKVWGKEMWIKNRTYKNSLVSWKVIPKGKFSFITHLRYHFTSNQGPLKEMNNLNGKEKGRSNAECLYFGLTIIQRNWAANNANPASGRCNTLCTKENQLYSQRSERDFWANQFMATRTQTRS